MITIIGTGHVFDIGEPIMFLIKNIWPQAVLVELDVTRYNILAAEREESEEKGTSPKQEKQPWIYRHSAKYQNQMAEEHGSNTGQELLVAVNTGKLVGAEIGFIDTDASKAMEEMWNEMPFMERFRYMTSTFRDSVVGKRGVDKTIEDFGQNEEKMIADLRRRYPTFVRKLLDERNEYMAEQIREYAARYQKIVVVCGDAHVEGIAEILSDLDVMKVRLNDVLDKKKLDELRKIAWNHKEDEMDDC